MILGNDLLPIMTEKFERLAIFRYVCSDPLACWPVNNVFLLFRRAIKVVEISNISVTNKFISSHKFTKEMGRRHLSLRAKLC